MAVDVIRSLEQEQQKEVPTFGPGDTVRLHAYADQVDLVVGAVALASVGITRAGSLNPSSLTKTTPPLNWLPSLMSRLSRLLNTLTRAALPRAKIRLKPIARHWPAIR